MTTNLAHGLATREDLPLPFAAVLTGALLAIAVSFVILGLAWRTPRLDADRPGLALASPLSTGWAWGGWRWVLRAVGLVGLVLVIGALAAGSRGADNPVPWVVYVLLWVGVVPLSVLLGPVYRWVNPVRTVHLLLHRAAGLDPGPGVRAMPAWGWWPGALGLLGFVWLELAVPDSTSRAVLAVAVALYVTVQLLGGAVFGVAWFARGDPFEVWSWMFGSLAPVARRGDGRVVVRSPLVGVSRVGSGGPQDRRGLVAVVAVMLGSTAFDSVGSSVTWRSFSVSAPGIPWFWDTLGLVAVAGVVGALLVGCTRAAAALAGVRGGEARQAPGRLAHSVVPVALGYVVAHYYSFLVVEGQNAVLRLSDPLGRGWDLLGVGERAVDPTLASPGITGVVQVTAIVTGHVLGVVLAHDRALRLFPTRPVLSQVPLLALMLAYTCGGLLLLFAA